MSEGYVSKSCDYCDRQTSCSNIYVALKIAESELRHCKSEDLSKRYDDLYRDVTGTGYQYPHSQVSCDLANDAPRTAALLSTLRILLADIRSHISGVVKAG